MLIVPLPVACLIRAGVWQDLLVRVSWHKGLRTHEHHAHSLLPNWPPQDALVWRLCGMHAAPVQLDSGSQADEFQTTADAMRSFAPHLPTDAQAQLSVITPRLMTGYLAICGDRELAIASSQAS
jgi:hypothetical protein